jgi:hypothetical protein
VDHGLVAYVDSPLCSVGVDVARTCAKSGWVRHARGRRCHGSSTRLARQLFPCETLISDASAGLLVQSSRLVVWRLLDLFKRHGVQITFFAAGGALE